jgi:hypothetical protein
MKTSKGLSSILRQNLTMNKRRVDCLCSIMMALMVVRTVSLPQLAVAFLVGSYLIHVRSACKGFFLK